MSEPGSPQEAALRSAVTAAAFDDPGFRRLTLTGNRDLTAFRWARVTVRPVALRGQAMLQFVYAEGAREEAKNEPRAQERGAARARLDEVLAAPFAHVDVQSASGDLHARRTRQGKVLMTHGKPSQPGAPPDLGHDRVKPRPLSGDASAAFLDALGVCNAEGRVRPGMRAKHTQIMQFVGLIAQTLGPALDDPAPLHLVDCGCGSAYLTFAAFHYLTAVRGRTVSAEGVDINAAVIAKVRAEADALGWPGLSFHVASIRAFAPARPPDLVLSLHACDTATDEAIAQGILWGSPWILCAPCCQHE
ncbi:MAG: SAM-dependent methyltransferase, partial [Chloroflexota bacterium]